LAIVNGEEPTQVDAYWSKSPTDLLASLHATAGGLSEDEAQARLAHFGPNRLEVKDKATPLKLLLNQFRSPIVLILLFATGVSAVVQEWVDAGIILAIVLGSAALSFFQEYSASSAVEKLRAQVTVKATVLRGGESRSIPAEEVVPGDVVLLSAGSLVPADGVVLQEKDFFVNQAVLTGETFPVEKTISPVAAGAALSERTNCVFMGTNVRSGSARAVIVQTGASTAFGQIAERLTLRPPETDFERGIRHFGYLLTEVMTVLVLVVFALNVYFHKPVIDSLLFSIALAVGLTPQLLPAIISINLSKGSQDMASQGVIVRRLASIENFGSMDVLCTDKTGTLTEGVVQLDAAYDVQGRPSDAVFRYAYLNAHFESGLANPLDDAIASHARPDITGVAKLDEIPYDFVRKRLSVVVQDAGKGDVTSPLLITKGALDNVLSVCSHVQDGADTLPIADAQRADIQRRFQEWSGQGYRVLGVAIKSLPPAEDLPEAHGVTRADEFNLVFVGFLLFFDPPKSGVLQTITSLSELGVQLKIITGDNKLVALHTADQVGLEVTGVLTGAEMNDMREEALWHAVDRVNLFAEVDPNQKERIILALRKTGHVVGYMGDGINDAPSLHSADVSISVDQAVDVAKQAADFVLLEHDLAVLLRGIELGRNTFANTMKYIFVTTSASFGNMFSMAGASLFLKFLPLLPAQILLTNFLTDFPATTIARDNVDRELVARPQRWSVRNIRNFMFTFGTVSSAFDYLTFGLLLVVLNAGQDEFRTAWFLESVMTELLIMLVIRTRKPFFKSRPGRYLLMSTLVVAGIALILPYSPLSRLLGFTPLSAQLLVALGAVTALYILVSEGTKRWFFTHLQR
jgi:Mg2+-importing ATPase